MNDDSRIGLLIADEHPMCREALRNLLERENGFIVRGEAASGQELLDMAPRMTPGVVLMDLGISGPGALDVLAGLKQSSVTAPVLVLAESVDGSKVVEMLRRGASGVVMKASSSSILFKSIRAVNSGEYWIGRSNVADLIQDLRNSPESAQGNARPSPFNLTRRELEIITQVTEGCTNKNIADKLSIAEQTVKHHLTSIFQKVGVSNRLELAVFAMHRRIATGPINVSQ